MYIHIDMDAYYAQAEQKLLQIPEDVPVCARQWNSLIAINYLARAAGIKRGMLSEEALKLCPQVLLPHVETFKVIDGKMVFSTLQEKYTQHSQYEEKVSLRYYRQESKLIFAVIKRFCANVEKGGTDEAYIQLNENEIQHIETDEFVGHLIGQLPPQLSEHDKLLMKASALCQQIRDAIFNETKYKCSAGISFNKMLAKLASATNKPNKQTIILESMLPECIQNVSINKIRGFGGKVQETLIESGLKTVGQAQQLSIHELQVLFGEKAQYIYDKLRGYDDEPVKKDVDQKNKSILSLKNIKKTSSREIVIQSLELIIHDITMRVTDYFEDHNLVPSVLVLHYHNVFKGSHQKSESLYLTQPIESFRISIEEKVVSLLNSVTDAELFPLVHIGLSCRYFKPIAQGIQNSIKQYFIKKQDGKPQNVDKPQSVQKQQNIEKPQNVDKPASKSHDPQESYVCENCGQSVPKSEKDSHNDFHVAELLDREMNPKKRKYRNSNQIQQNK